MHAGTALMPCLLRFFGAHVGKNLLVAEDSTMSILCFDARHMTIGDGLVVNHGAAIIPHSVDRGLIGHRLMRYDQSFRSVVKEPQNWEEC